MGRLGLKEGRKLTLYLGNESLLDRFKVEGRSSDFTEKVKKYEE